MRSSQAQFSAVQGALALVLTSVILTAAGCSDDSPTVASESAAADGSDANGQAEGEATDSSQASGEEAESGTTDGSTESAVPEPRSVKIAGDDTILISGDQASFVMPSGNIQCVLRVGSAVCQIANKSFEPAVEDMSDQVLGDCTAANADAITVLEGEAAAWTCTSETIRGQAAIGLGGWWAAQGVGTSESVEGADLAVLNYGQKMQLSTILCSSETTGISCRDTAGTAGFSLARESYHVD